MLIYCECGGLLVCGLGRPLYCKSCGQPAANTVPDTGPCGICGLPAFHATALGCVTALQRELDTVRADLDEAAVTGYGKGWLAAIAAVKAATATERDRGTDE